MCRPRARARVRVQACDSPYDRNEPKSYCALSLNTRRFVTNQIFSILSVGVVVIVRTAGPGRACSRCNLLAAGVTAALFILQRTPSDSADQTRAAAH